MIESILKAYGIEQILIKKDEKIGIVILKRKECLNLSRWISFINALKRAFQKEIEFYLLDEINLSEFRKVMVNDNE